MQPLVSIIIPVYNVEKYLDKCLNSLINQTLKNIEIICVDDGSKDNSLNILKNYALKDDRVVILQQSNLHAGIARNNGLKIAKANYIIFLDSDDFFAPDMIESLYNKIIEDNSDVAICGFYKYDNKTQRVKNRPIQDIFIKRSPFNPLDLGIDTFSFTNPAPWTKLFKKSIFIDNNIKFEDYICCNDLTCMILALACCKKVSTINKCYIYYRANQETNLTANRSKHVKYVLYALDKAEKELKRLNLYQVYEKAFLRRAKNSLKYELSLCSKEEREKALLEGKDILSNSLYQILYELIYIPKISIIIPVYNSEQYLNECLDSVINQTEPDIEIVCVNDASTDNSLNILNEYGAKDKRIKIISLTENGGVSNARNIALERISGECVCFLDSDDFVEQDFCKLLYTNLQIKHSDLSCGGHCKVNKLQNKISRWLPTQDISKNGIDDILSFTKHRNVTQKLFKTKIIKDNNIKFDLNLHYMEDALFLVTYLTHCKIISSIRKVLYNVRINDTSLCRNPEFIERRRAESEKAKSCINEITLQYKQSK